MRNRTIVGSQCYRPHFNLRWTGPFRRSVSRSENQAFSPDGSIYVKCQSDGSPDSRTYYLINPTQMNTSPHWISMLCVMFLTTASAKLSADTTLLSATFDSGTTETWQTTLGSVAINNSVGLNGNALVFTSVSGSSNTTRVAYTGFSSTTLENAGDTLAVSFAFKGLIYTNNNANRVVFGLFNSQGTAGVGDDLGYAGMIRADPRTDRSAPYSNFRSLEEGPSFEVEGYTGTILAATVTEGVQFYLNGAVDVSGSTGNIGSAMQFTYSITRQANNDLLLRQTFTNTVTSASFTSTATIAAADVHTYSFDTLSLGHFRAGGDFAIDDLSVTFTSTIPEPGSYAAVAGLFTLAGAVMLRRNLR